MKIYPDSHVITVKGKKTKDIAKDMFYIVQVPFKGSRFEEYEYIKENYTTLAELTFNNNLIKFDSSRVYHLLSDGTFEVCGCTVSDDPSIYQPRLYHSSYVDDMPDIMIRLDGSEYLVEDLPDDFLTPEALEKRQLHQPITNEVETLVRDLSRIESSLGTIEVSGYTLAGLAPHVFGNMDFLEDPSSITDGSFNRTEQLLFASTSPTAQEMVGYKFNVLRFKLRELVVVGRISLNPKDPAEDVPFPKLVDIEILKDDTWETLSQDVALPPVASTQFPEGNTSEENALITKARPLYHRQSIDFSSIPEEYDSILKGVRLVVKEWYPGKHEAMQNGIARLIIRGIVVHPHSDAGNETPGSGKTQVVPFITPPNAQFVYAQYNPTKRFVPDSVPVAELRDKHKVITPKVTSPVVVLLDYNKYPSGTYDIPKDTDHVFLVNRTQKHFQIVAPKGEKFLIGNKYYETASILPAWLVQIVRRDDNQLMLQAYTQFKFDN